jgi:hypothetical protein
MSVVSAKQFSAPDELRTMQLGRFEIVNIGGVTVGRATYEPGWKMVRSRRAQRRH